MPLTPAEEDTLIEIVRTAAREHVMPRFRRLDAGAVTAKSAVDDLVTVADREAEEAITAALAQALPDAVVVGEEAVEDDPSLTAVLPTAPRAIILDPVDGTWNFAAGLATFGMIVAVTEAGETVFGLLYDPVLDDWVLARRGGGTWFGRPGAAPQRLQLAPEAPEAMAALASVGLFPRDQHDRLAGNLTDLAGQGRVGALRCSCHEYRLACFGKVDMVLSGMSKAWDHAAGQLAMTEAGGGAGYLDGTPYRAGPDASRPLLAARSPAVYAAALDRFGWLEDGEEARG